MTEVFEELSRSLPSIATSISSEVAQQCADNILVRNIAREFRGTKKEVPTLCSPYVKTIFQPWILFQSKYPQSTQVLDMVRDKVILHTTLM